MKNKTLGIVGLILIVLLLIVLLNRNSVKNNGLVETHKTTDSIQWLYQTENVLPIPKQNGNINEF